MRFVGRRSLINAFLDFIWGGKGVRDYDVELGSWDYIGIIYDRSFQKQNVVKMLLP